MSQPPGPLSELEGRNALVLARSSLEHFARIGRRLAPEQPFTGGLALPCGAFVTLHAGAGELRGCIGHMIGNGPVGELILDLAIAAGMRDPRFEPVTPDELDNLHYEVSVLSPMQQTAAADVTPGLHGLYVRRGAKSGVLLPQVASEWGWDRETFLDHACRKAGLPTGAWRNAATEVLTFTAQIFNEGHRRAGAATQNK
jgi:hypothetical protein